MYLVMKSYGVYSEYYKICFKTYSKFDGVLFNEGIHYLPEGELNFAKASGTDRIRSQQEGSIMQILDVSYGIKRSIQTNIDVIS